MSDCRGEAFERALDEARRNGRAPDSGGPAAARRVRMGPGAPLGSASPAGGEARYGLALDWAGDPADRPLPPQAGQERDPEKWMPAFGQDHAQNKDLERGSDSIGADKALSERARPPADTPAEIAAELGLGAPLSLAKLTVRWRDFVWRNHPDRQPVEARERANARVAIANALYERARRELA